MWRTAEDSLYFAEISSRNAPAMRLILSSSWSFRGHELKVAFVPTEPITKIIVSIPIKCL